MMRWLARYSAAIMFAVWTWLAAGPVNAAESLTLGEVLRSVAGTHPEIESADAEVSQAGGEALAARGGFDPMLTVKGNWLPVGYYRYGQIDTMIRQPTPAWGVSLYAGYRLGLGNYPVYNGDLETLSAGEMRAGADIPLWRDGPIDARRANIRRSRHALDGSQALREATELQLQGEAAAAYWAWVAAGRQLYIAGELLAIAERRDMGLREQAAAGAIEAIRLVDNRRLVLDRMRKVVAADQEFASATLKLSLYYRDGDNTPIRAGKERVPRALPEPISPDLLPIEHEVAGAIERRPDVAAMEAARRISQVDIRLARNQRAPAVNLQTYVARDLGEGPQRLAPADWGAGIVMKFPLPLRKARGELRAAKAGVASVDARLRGLYDKIEVEVRMAHVALRAAEKGVSLARRQLSAADRLAAAERTRFDEGISDLVFVNLRELAVADAATQEVDALADYQRAHSDFMVSTGRSPSTSCRGCGP